MVESVGYEVRNCAVFFGPLLVLCDTVTMLKHHSLVFFFIKIKEGKMHVEFTREVRNSYKF
jgi:hypothetical protein